MAREAPVAMPKDPKGRKRPADVISNAVHVMKIATGEIDDASARESKNGLAWYVDAVDNAFGIDIDYGMIQKTYGGQIAGDRSAASRYSPAKFKSATKEVIRGNPNPKHISTSFVERSNLSMRMHMRRFTRLTNGFSKKVENHAHMVALYTVWYNWIKVHTTLRVTPAMQAGLSDRVFEMTDLVELIEQAEAPQPASLSESHSA
jgi:hypothetical protein